MRAAACEGDRAAVDRLLGQPSRPFAGNEWVGAVLDAMKSIADNCSRERMMKEAMYASGMLCNRLTAKDEDVRFSISEESTGQPCYLRRKPAQGKAGA